MVAFDLDGVIWRGGEVLPGVGEALEDVLRRGLTLRYVSNNSTAHRRTVSARLAALGLPAGEERVLTSAFVTGRWLRARLPAGAPIMVVGETGLLEELTEAGFAPFCAAEWRAEAVPPGGAALSEGAVPPGGAAPPAGTAPPDHSVPPAVVVGMDRSFDFKVLAAAQAAIRAGALFVATNRDATFPTPEGELPGAGAIVAAVATAGEAEPVVMGKPGMGMAEVLVSTTGIAAADTLFVGDRISTDIVMGNSAGMTTVLVLTGVTTPHEWDEIQGRAVSSSLGAGRDDGLPDHVLADLRSLPSLLDRLGL